MPLKNESTVNTWFIVLLYIFLFSFIPLLDGGNLDKSSQPLSVVHYWNTTFCVLRNPFCGQYVDINPWLSSPFQAISFCKDSANAWNHKIKQQYFAYVWTTFHCDSLWKMSVSVSAMQLCTRSFVIIYFNGPEQCHSIIFRLVKESKVH